MGLTCRRLSAALCVSSALSSGTVLAQSLPTGGQVVSGGAVIAQPNAQSLLIFQQSQNAIVNWQSFSIGQQHGVNIFQPSPSSAILNRVTGSTPSTIAGQLNANGQVFLVNPNGIAITRTGVVNAGGFVASTLDISNQDFKNGKLAFHGNGQSAAVSNAGTISILPGGYAALIGGTVDNSGTITVPLGKVGLASGESVTLDLAGDGFLQVAVPTKVKGDQPLISHSGKIQADGGRVEIQAAVAREAARNTVNLTGLIQARSIAGRSGAIVIGGGTVNVPGRLVASGYGRANGGSISISGQKLVLSGSLTAKGRNGGTITTKAPTVDFADAKVNTRGSNGTAGIWLIDTASLTLDSGKAQSISTNLARTNIIVTAKASGNDPGDVLIAAPISWSSPLGLTIDSAHAITVNAAVTVAGAGKLGLAAAADPDLHTGSLLAFGPSGNIQFTGTPGSGQALSINKQAYHLLYTVDDLLSVNNDLSGAYALAKPLDTAGVTYTQALIAPNTSFNGILEGLGNNISNLTIAAPAGSSSTGLLGSIGATGLVEHLNLVGGTISGSNFVGGLAGSNDGSIKQVSSGVNILGLNTVGGLVGSNNASGVIVKSSSAGALTANDSNGSQNLPSITFGGFVGSNAGVINQSSATGAVVSGYHAEGNFGGFAGLNSGTITQSFSTGRIVSLSNSSIVFSTGGFVGLNNTGGQIDQAYATGTVLGTREVGGFVGSNDGSIANAYATGTISGSMQVAGFAGVNSGTLTSIYSIGRPGAPGPTSGLVAVNFGTVTNGYWDIQTSGQTSSAAGTGLTTAQLQAGLPAGFDPAVWSIIPGSSYPFLTALGPTQ